MGKLRLRIEQDHDPMNPREEYDNLGTMLCSHKRYNLGDEDATPEWLKHEQRHGWYYDEEGKGGGWTRKVKVINSWEDVEKQIRLDVRKQGDDIAVMLPLYLYDHSGITISTSPFNCPWDSGRVGLIYITKSRVREEWSVKRITKTVLSRVRHLLEDEVKVYDAYLTGDVWGYIIEEVEENEEGDEVSVTEIGGCWQYFGKEYAEQDGAADLEHFNGLA